MDNLSTLDTRIDNLRNIIRRGQIGADAPVSASARDRVSTPLVQNDFPGPGFSQDDLELIRQSGWRGDDANAGGDAQTPMSSVSDQSFMPMQAPPSSPASASTMGSLARRTQTALRISIPEVEEPPSPMRLPVSSNEAEAVAEVDSEAVAEAPPPPNPKPKKSTGKKPGRRPYTSAQLEKSMGKIAEREANAALALHLNPSEETKREYKNAQKAVRQQRQYIKDRKALESQIYIRPSNAGDDSEAYLEAYAQSQVGRV